MTTPIKTIISKTWKVILPITTSRILMVSTGFFGTLIIARTSSEVLAASNLISAIQAFFFFLGASLLFSVSAMAGHAYGAKRHEDIGAIFQQALLLGSVTSLPIMLFEWNIGYFLLKLKQDPQVALIVQDYFRAYLWVVPAIAIVIACQQIVLAVNKRRFIFYMSIFTFFFALSLAWVFVHVFHMGVAGLAIAYVIHSWVSVGIYFYYMYQEKDFDRYAMFDFRIKTTLHLLKKLVQIGWPITVQNTLDLFIFVLFGIFAGWLGLTALAAQQIVNQYFILLCVPIFSIAQASTILIGQARGANELLDVNRYAYATLGFAIFFSFIVLLVFVLFPDLLIQLYTGPHAKTNPMLASLAHTVLILTAVRLLFDAIFEVKMGSLRGLYDTQFPMIVTLFGIVLLLPLAYLFGFTLSGGLVGIVLAGLITTLFSALVLWWRWHVMVNRSLAYKRD